MLGITVGEEIGAYKIALGCSCGQSGGRTYSLDIEDDCGNLGKVTSILGKFRINIDKVIQNNKALKSKTIPVIILTKSLELKTLNKALKDITKKKLIQKESLIIPVEDLA